MKFNITMKNRCIGLALAVLMVTPAVAYGEDCQKMCGDKIKQLEGEIASLQKQINGLQAENAKLQAEISLKNAEDKRRVSDKAAIDAELQRLKKASDTSKQSDASGKSGKTISPEEVKNGLSSMAEAAKKCGSEGKLTVSFDVEKTGKVQNIKSKSGSLKDTDAEKCIFDVIENYQFPVADKPVKNISYSFKL